MYNRMNLKNNREKAQEEEEIFPFSCKKWQFFRPPAKLIYLSIIYLFVIHSVVANNNVVRVKYDDDDGSPYWYNFLLPYGKNLFLLPCLFVLNK